MVRNLPGQADALLFAALGTDAVEVIDRREQGRLVVSEMLPSESLHTSDSEYEALGFKLEPPDTQDPMFRRATLPEGWRKEGSSHAMHSFVVDQEGYRMVSVFYKGAFYDRRANMGLNSRFYQNTAAQLDAWTELERSVTRNGQDAWSQWHPSIAGRQRRPDGSSFFVYGFFSIDKREESFDQDLGTWPRTGGYVLIALGNDGREIARVEWTVKHSTKPTFPARGAYEARGKAQKKALEQFESEAVEGFPGWPADSGLA